MTDDDHGNQAYEDVALPDVNDIIEFADGTRKRFGDFTSSDLREYISEQCVAMIERNGGIGGTPPGTFEVVPDPRLKDCS